MSSSGRFAQVQAPVKFVHSNLDQEIIQITEDKLRLVLNEHVSHVEQRKSWIAPLGILIAIITAFATSNFKDAFLIKSATWEAIFIITGIISLSYLIICIVTAVKCPSVQDIVDKIKNRSVKE